MSGESHSQKVDLLIMGGSHVPSEEGAQPPREIPEKDHWQSIPALTERRQTYHSIDHILLDCRTLPNTRGPLTGARLERIDQGGWLTLQTRLAHE